MNSRGIEPGTIDTNYRPVIGAQSAEANHRGLVPGRGGRDQEAIKDDPILPPVPDVFSQEKAALIRRTGRMYCPISGCDFESQSTRHDQGLRAHLTVKHPVVNASRLLREVRTLLDEHEAEQRETKT